MAIKNWAKTNFHLKLVSNNIEYKKISTYTFLVGTLHIFIGNKRVEISAPDLVYPSDIKKEILLTLDVEAFQNATISFDKDNKLMIIDDRVALKYGTYLI